MKKPFQDAERTIEFEFVRATENAALNAMHWIGKGDKESADAAACDAIYGVFDLVDICGEVVIGEGIKDNAPGIFLGDRLGTWREGAPHFDIALDPVDGTTNISKGMANSISVMAAAEAPPGGKVMKNIPSFYLQKIAYGPAVAKVIGEFNVAHNWIDQPLAKTLQFIAKVLGKRVPELVVLILDRARNQSFIDQVRESGASLRMVSDGDITAAVAPSLPNSGIDLYVGIGGTPEGILTATALRALGGDIQMRMWFKDEAAKKMELGDQAATADIGHIFTAEEIVPGDSAIFCATGISDSALLPGVKLIGNTAITHSILMRARSQTVRHIQATHNLQRKTIHLRSDQADHKI